MNATQTRSVSDQTLQEAIEKQTLSLDEVAYCTGTSRTFILGLIEEDLVRPCETWPEPRFATSVFQDVRRMLRLHGHLDIQIEAMGLVLSLLDRIDALERVLHERQGKSTQR